MYEWPIYVIGNIGEIALSNSAYQLATLSAVDIENVSFWKQKEKPECNKDQRWSRSCTPNASTLAGTPVTRGTKKCHTAGVNDKPLTIQSTILKTQPIRSWKIPRPTLK